MNRQRRRGITMIELVVVLLIVSILSTVAVGIYTQEVVKAKIARTRAEIRTLEVAVHAYKLDTGQFPPGSTGTQLAPGVLNQQAPFTGSGYLHLALRSSLNGDQNNPLSNKWAGPYMDWDENKLGTLSGSPIGAGTSAAEIQYLDPWGNPYYYISSDEYGLLDGTELPADHPFSSTERYYNVSTFQIISFGPDGMTNTSLGFLGTDPDDLVNWESSSL